MGPSGPFIDNVALDQRRMSGLCFVIGQLLGLPFGTSIVLSMGFCDSIRSLSNLYKAEYDIVRRSSI